MCVYEVPDEGGETEFISARAAYARLDPAEQEKIDPLIAVHDYVFSRSKVTTVSDSHAASLPPVPQKLVRVNPRTGAKNYYVGSHAKSIQGWSETDSRDLLNDLLTRATLEALMTTDQSITFVARQGTAQAVAEFSEAGSRDAICPVMNACDIPLGFSPACASRK